MYFMYFRMWRHIAIYLPDTYYLRELRMVKVVQSTCTIASIPSSSTCSAGESAGILIGAYELVKEVL